MLHNFIQRRHKDSRFGNRRNPTAGINDLLSGMVVVTLCLGTMIVCRLGYGNELPISDASLRDDVVGHVLHRVRLPLEHSDLKAALSVEVHMQRRDREMVVAMELVGEPIGQVAPAMVVHVDQGGHAGLAFYRRLGAL